MGTGLGHYIPLVAYIGFWLMCLISIFKRPLWGLYYLIPFIPYRSMRDHFLDYPLGANLLTLLILCVIVGGFLHGKRLPKSGLYRTWLLYGFYLYVSMWLGSLLGNAPTPLWLTDVNFLTWKDYMLIPLLFVAAGLVLEDRKSIRTAVILTGFSLFLVDKSALLESMTHNLAVFDENKRSGGPLVFGSNQLAAYLAQFCMFFWGIARMLKRKKVKLLLYSLVALTAITTMYTFSRGAYLALLCGVLLLAVLKDRKWLIGLTLFLISWQTIVPPSVVTRVTMTQTASGTLEASAQERVKLWEQSKQMFFSDPILGTGYATFQFGEHTDNLKDTHNWFVKVLVETGVIGGIFALVLLSQMMMLGYRLFRQATDPLYTAVGLGFVLAVAACIVANCFGDRWTYIEITGQLWVMAAAAARALQLTASEAEEPVLASNIEARRRPVALSPRLEWR